MKESDIVKKVIENWNEYMGIFDIEFYKTEFKIKIDHKYMIDSRVDIMAYRKINNKRIPIAIECKYGTKSSRDLENELERLLTIKQYQKECRNSNMIVCVLADTLSNTTKQYLKKNNIAWFRYILNDKDEIEKILLESIK